MEFHATGNNGWLFQKAYYNGFNWNDKDSDTYAPPYFEERLNWLKKTSLIIQYNDGATSNIPLSIIYPGLATGIGITHESKSKGELKLGFEFDYSSGMPIIRGHSVKGALRAAFPQQHRKNVKYKKEKAYQLQCWIENIPASLEGFDAFNQDNTLYEKIVAIELEIFDGNINGKLLSSYKQDAFFEAFILQASNHEKTINQYLGSDSITPHGDNPLKNPVPIPFLKVLPGVVFDFRFALHDNGLLSVMQKENLFRKILLNNGIGAKTNVGYGQLTEARVSPHLQSPVNKQTFGKDFLKTPPKKTVSQDDIIPTSMYKYLKNGKSYSGNIVEADENYVYAEFTIDTLTMGIYKKADKVPGARVGKKALIKINKDFTVTEKLNCKISCID